MKKIILASVAMFLFVLVGFSQAIKDRNVIPVAVNLNQVLRMTVTSGGNIEFVFNTIDEYKNGIDGTGNSFYQTNFTVASSTRWAVTYGAEDATFIGTDNPANTLALDNVGLGITNNAAHTFEASGNAKGTTATELFSAPTDNANSVSALQVYPVLLIEDNDNATSANAGDATDNDFTLTWYCGTSEAGAVGYVMNTEALIDQSPSPTSDRYQSNVIFELAIDN